MLSQTQSQRLTMLREMGVVSAEVLRQAIDSILIQYQPMIKIVEETRERRERLRQLGISVDKSHHRQGVNGGTL
jgi:hypothetical protein